MRQFERMAVLQVVDTLWQDHIDHLDVMRAGIGLRGVAQRDPLVEFKREAYQAFEQLKVEIEHHIADLLFRAPVQIQLQEPPKEALPQNLHTNVDDIAKLSGQSKNAGSASAKPRQLPAPAQNGAAAQPAAAKGASGQQPGGNRAQNGRNGTRPAASQAKGGAHRQQPQRVAAAAAAGAPSASGAATKLGRNDPCYCGSGRKYKQCHGR